MVLRLLTWLTCFRMVWRICVVNVLNLGDAVDFGVILVPRLKSRLKSRSRDFSGRSVVESVYKLRSKVLKTYYSSDYSSHSIYWFWQPIKFRHNVNFLFLSFWLGAPGLWLRGQGVP